jgi:putative endonuclease
MAKINRNWSLYIIEASDASLYTGITTDVERRFAEHLEGPRGARYFNGRNPLRVIYREDGHSRSSASRREAEIKKLSRRAKQRLIAGSPAAADPERRE